MMIDLTSSVKDLKQDSTLIRQSVEKQMRDTFPWKQGLGNRSNVEWCTNKQGSHCFNLVLVESRGQISNRFFNRDLIKIADFISRYNPVSARFTF